MAGSSPPAARRRSYQWSSPQRSVLSDYSYEGRNSEVRHKQLLENAANEHARVREEAERVYKEYLQREEHRRLLEETRKEQERIRLETEIAAERARVQALKEKTVPQPPSPSPAVEKAPTESTAPPRPGPSLPVSSTPVPRPEPIANGVDGPKVEPPASTSIARQAFSGPPAVPTTGTQISATGPFRTLQTGGPQQLSSFKLTTPLNEPPKPSQQPKPPPATTIEAAIRTTSQPAPAAPSGLTGSDRYVTVHQNLKKLRNFMAEQAKTNRPLKARMGDMRREIRKSVGQLTSGRGANAKQTDSITRLLREAITSNPQSVPVDPNEFLLQPRTPVEGALHNEPQLPSLFLYLLNLFCKAAMSQWANEGSAKPETAGPVGVVVVAIFAEPEFLWRGASMIDMMIAKFRVACPVLFGLRGSEKTEQGRARLGWRKEYKTEWISEQQHFDRMGGLGAGFAAIALRSFGKSKKRNPYPPTHYWTAMAKIVDTPGVEISSTQCVVLKAMIANVETKFIAFYGNAAIAALRAALIEFPAKAAEKTPYVNALLVHAEVLKKDLALVLDQ